MQTPGDFPSLLTQELVGPAWLDTPSVYGPLFSHLAGVVTRISDRLDVLVDAFRVIAIAASLATTFVIGAVVRRHRPGRAAFAVAAFGLNPVVLFQGAASGHNDLLVALAIAVAAWFVLGDRTMWAVAVLSMGALVKASAVLPVLLLVVWVAWRRPVGERLRAFASHAGLAAGIAVVVAAPFLQLHDPTLGMAELSSHEGWLAPSDLPADPRRDQRGHARRRGARRVRRGLFVAMTWLVFAVARAATSGLPRTELLAGWGWALLALTLLGPVLLPWYLVDAPAALGAAEAAARQPDRALGRARALAVDGGARSIPDAYDLNVLIGHYVLTPIAIGLLVWLAVDLRRRVAIPLALADEEEEREAAEARQG